MNDFQNRLNLQRIVLNLINSQLHFNEPLASLSKSCIDRWTSNNPQVLRSTYGLLIDISEKIFFLATKSQEQITEEYAFNSLIANEGIQQLKSHIINCYS